MKVTKKEAIERLEKLENNYKYTKLQRDVASIIVKYLDEYEDPKRFFSELFEHGCVSGLISELIYHKDTYKFFDDHYDDIMELINEWDFDLNKDGDPKNYGAWFGFEETAGQLANMIGIEL